MYAHVPYMHDFPFVLYNLPSICLTFAEVGKLLHVCICISSMFIVKQTLICSTKWYAGMRIQSTIVVFFSLDQTGKSKM